MEKNSKKFKVLSKLDCNKNKIEFCVSSDSIENGQLDKQDKSVICNINKAIEGIFEKFNTRQLNNYNEFKKLIDNKEFEKACDIFVKNMFFRYGDCFDYLNLIDFDSINDKDKVAIIMLAKCKIKEDNEDFKYIADEVPSFLEKYRNSVDNKGIIDEFEYITAFANFNLNKRELALVLLNKQLKDKAINNSVKRRIYGLKAEIEKNTKYLEVAGDIALEDGDIKEVIALRMKLADNLISFDASKAVDIIESLEQLCKLNNIEDELVLAKILFNKANYLFLIKDYKQALAEVEKAIYLISNIAGDSVNSSRYSYYGLALQLAQSLDIKDKVKEYTNKLNILRKNIKDEDFIEQLSISDLIEDKKYDELNLLKDSQLERGNYYAVFLINMALAISEDIAFNQKISLLDETISIIDKIPAREIDKSLIYHIYAHTFLRAQICDKFIEYAKMSLNINPYNHELRHNYIAILIQENRWGDVEKFCQKCIDRFGELPNIMFLYAKSICMQNADKDKLGMAISILANIIPKLTEDVQNEAKQILIEQNKNGIIPNDRFYQKEKSANFTVTLSDFEAALDDFKKNIEEKVRMSFWKRDKTSKNKHIYVEHPETMAKTNFISFFNSRFGDNVRIVDECTAGAGFIDIYLIFATFTVVVELKMCGHGYSSTYALEGKEQLKHYLGNSDSSLGYLLVFDSRIRDINKYFNEMIDGKKYTIITKAIDIRPMVK